MRLSNYAIGFVFLAVLALQPPALGNDAQWAANRELALMRQRLAEMEARMASVQPAEYQTAEQYEESYMEPPNEYVPEGEYMPGAEGEYYGDEYGGYTGGGYGGDSCCGNGSCGGYGGGDGCCGGYGGGNGCGDGCCGSCGGGNGWGWCGGGNERGCACEPSCGYGYEPDCGCGYGCEPSCGAGYGAGCGTGAGYDNCPQRPGWIGYAQAVFLRPQDSAAFQSQTDFDIGSRYLIGYTNGRGHTIRARYFNYQADDVGSSNWLEIQMADLEYAANFQLGRNWSGDIGGGVRWAKFNNENTFDFQYFDSVGPVIGAELRANPWPFLAFIVGVRQSLQFGHPYEQSGSSTFRQDLGSFGITEMELGLEWQGCVCGGQSFVRGTIEAQQYEGAVDDGYEDQRLIGFGVALGIRR